MAKKNKKNNNRVFSFDSIIMTVAGLVAVAAPLLILRYKLFEISTNLLLFISCAALFVTAVIVFAVKFVLSIKQSKHLDIGGSVADMVNSSLNDGLQMPVVICDEKGRIVWVNNILKKKFEENQKPGLIKGVLHGKYIDNICDATISRIVKGDQENGVEVHFNDEIMGEGAVNETYMARGCEVMCKGTVYKAAVFTNISDLKAAYAALEENDTIIACAIIDNLDELVQYVQNMYSSATDDVEKILRSHMERIGGVLRDYGHNRFLMIFNARDLAEFEAKRFSMLDEVRQIYIGDTSIPVTISIGVAKIKGTLVEKEKTAQAALDMALQRGGDQVVVKSANDIEYYGGKTKTVQKRTKVRSRVIASEFIMFVEESDNVIVMGHKFADFDAIASCLAVARIAKSRGVKAYIVCDKKDKNLAGCFAMLEESGEDYEGVFVDKLEAQDLMMSGTLAVVVDVNNLEFSEAPDIVRTAKNTVIIDHHRKTAELDIKPSISYIEPSASSASELLSEFLEQLLPQGSLPKAEADLLYAGIMLDTKRFTHNVGMRTFSSALYLRSENANPLDAETLFKIGLKDFMLEAKFESNVITYKSVIAIALNESESKSSLIRINAAKAADRMLSVEGVHAAFALCKSGDIVHISARSEGNINVQLILEKMGGGGHFDSAGAQIRNSSIQQTLVDLRTAIDEYFKESGLDKERTAD